MPIHPLPVPSLRALSPRIRRAQAGDRHAMVDVWDRAVRSTHHFLNEHQINELRPAVVDVLASDALQWWVVDVGGELAGFLGVADTAIEALFIDPGHQRRGVGRLCIAHAQQLSPAASLSVDVNEDNREALAFYRHLGFVVIGRSATDDDGRPYPLLHLRRPAP